MTLKTALIGAVHLTGITMTLRLIYQPLFVTPEAIAVVVSRLEHTEDRLEAQRRD